MWPFGFLFRRDQICVDDAYLLSSGTLASLIRKGRLPALAMLVVDVGGAARDAEQLAADFAAVVAAAAARGRRRLRVKQPPLRLQLHSGGSTSGDVMAVVAATRAAVADPEAVTVLGGREA